jgi:hypothetical protein
MSIANIINSLKSQKTSIDDNIKEISKRCTSLREKREKLLIEREALMETHVTQEDFIECIAEAVRKRKEVFPSRLFRALRNEPYNSKMLEAPSFKKMSNDKVVFNAGGLILGADEYNPGMVTAEALFYVFNDLLVDGVKQALRDGFKAGTPVTGSIKKSFVNSKPMKEISALIDKIDGEISEIDLELEALTESASLFGAAV